MINSIKQEIVDKLLNLYPVGCTIYDEDITQDFKTHSFLIKLTNQNYSKRMNGKFKSILSFDVAYFSDKVEAEVKGDCLEVQLTLFRSFDLINNRIINKRSTITDNVLHFTFDVQYSEMNQQENIKMQQQQIKTRTEE